jgi:para-nitrobenzyl esterase
LKQGCGRLIAAVLSSAAVMVSCAGSPPAGRLQEPGQWTDTGVAATRFGAVQGFEDRDDTWVWKAVPFARPPVGDLRWRAPRDPVPWTGVRASRSFNGGCTQFSPVLRGGIVGSEDCLYLNVWRPRRVRSADGRADPGARGAETGLPVYVWIHGGGNSMGSATMVPDYYGSRLAARNRMVFVSLNYRLGPFGWFTHPALREGASAEDDSGNYGTLDILQALKWIRENISAFGGDPGNVTITGESAGGFNVLSLLISPRARGLFHRAMSQSGAARTRGMDEADAKSAATLTALLARAGKARTPEEAARVAAGMSRPEIAAFLRSRTDRQILGCFGSSALGMVDNPAILRDGVVIPAEGFDALSTGSYPVRVPVILGSNREELKLFLAFLRTVSWRTDLYQAVAKYGSRRWKASGVDEPARRMAAHADQPPVYAYLFSWGAPDARGKSVMPGNWGRRLGAFHSLEIPFFLGTDTVDGVFQNALYTRKNEPGRTALSAAMMEYAAQFARTGDPNRPGSGLPEWRPWTNSIGAPKCIVFDATADAAVIGMSDEELTDGGVMASLDADLPEPLRSRTRDALQAQRIPSGAR